MFPVIGSLFFKAAHRRPKQSTKSGIPTLVVAGKSLETGAPGAPQWGRKVNPKLFFSVDVVLNKTHGLGSPTGVFGMLGVSTAGKPSSSLIQNTFQVLISVSWGGGGGGGKETHQHLRICRLWGTARCAAQLSLLRPRVHQCSGNTGIINLPKSQPPQSSDIAVPACTIDFKACKYCS